MMIPNVFKFPLQHQVENKYGVGCECCVDFKPLLEGQYWRYRFFRKTAEYDFYFGCDEINDGIATQDNYSLGKRPALRCRIWERYSKWTSVERRRVRKVFYACI